MYGIEPEYTSQGMNSNSLKILACLLMLCDHIGLVLVNNNAIMRHIGRLAFPIFVFLLVEGMRHTRSVMLYFVRLLVFAIISEVPFDLAFHKSVWYFGGQNVFFTLAFAIPFVYCVQKIAHELKHERKYDEFLVPIVCALLILFAARALSFDYGIAGIILVALFYFFPPATLSKSWNLKAKWKRNLLLTLASAVIYISFFSWSELYALLAIIPIAYYNGERGENTFAIKYSFYAFYPAHLLILYLLSM